ncbi:uncharacterized protein LOC124595958 [Schistocerca americana]|uniref:uncharacterized protein LOC124595958 n=1 Tax=Schistocerca americana TaxID=7009 RepID=UPI001F502EC4|nr:uncharacterized protein LOC124595958 [Schistocerca americana]
MAAMLLRLALLAACCLAAAALHAGAGAQPGAQVEAVRDVFSRVLRLRPPAPTPDAVAAPTQPPPRHMLELYRKYAAGAARRPHHGNTVRSILPDPAWEAATNCALRE